MSSRDPQYAWGMANNSAHTLRYDSQVTCRQNGRELGAVYGVVMRENFAQFDLGLDPIPDVVHVHLVYEEDGSVHDSDVPVHGHIPDEARFTGVLWLVVTDRGVSLYPETPAMRSRRYTMTVQPPR